ncbi:MAG: hypothetical protein R8L58_04280 [Mariprofundaceae bacterium]
MTNSLPLFGQARGKLPFSPQGDGLFESPADYALNVSPDDHVTAGLTVSGRKVEAAQPSNIADSDEVSDGED